MHVILLRVQAVGERLGKGEHSSWLCGAWLWLLDWVLRRQDLW